MAKEIKIGQKTSIREVPVANKRLYKEIAGFMKIEPGQVEDMVGFLGEFTASMIRRGEGEAVMIPYFGKFKPQESLIRAFNKVKANEASGMDLLYRAMRGKPIIDKRKKTNNTDETI